MLTKNDRIVSYDILKTISIFLVLFCHFTLLKNDSILANIGMLTSWVSVPCFMMVSGVLIGRRIKSDISWCIKKIFISYVGIAVMDFVYLIVQMRLYDLHFCLKDMIGCVLLFKALEGINTDITWYMKAYIMVLCFTPVISFLYNQGKKGFKLLWFILILLLLQAFIIPELWFWVNEDFANLAVALPFNSWANMLFFFILGIWCFEYKDFILRYLNRCWFAFIFVMGLVDMLLTQYKFSGSFTWINVYLNNGYNRLGTIMMAFALFGLVCFYEQPKWLAWIGGVFGKNTLGIYYIHYLLLMVICYYLYPYLESYRGFITNCIKTVVILIISNLITLVLKKIPGIQKIF